MANVPGPQGRDQFNRTLAKASLLPMDLAKMTDSPGARASGKLCTPTAFSMSRICFTADAVIQMTTPSARPVELRQEMARKDS